MAFGKKIGTSIKNIIDPNAAPKKKGKGKDFMNGLKDFFTSPGGIATIVLFVAAMWYIHHKTAKPGKA